MITINTEKGWVRIESWDDVISNPGYADTINPDNVELDAVIGRYIEREKKICGLSICRTRHNRGYLVSTKDGRTTNIGKDCGKKHFGVEFETMARILDQEVESQDNRERISTAIANVPRYKEELETLLFDSFGAKWANKLMTRLTSHNPSSAINRHMVNMMKTENGEIKMQRKASDEEVQLMVAAGGLSKSKASRNQYISETIGLLKGITALSRWKKLREILTIDLEPQLAVLAGLDVREMGSAELRYWSKWSSEIQSKLDTARSILSECCELLIPENLLQLTPLEPDREEQVKFKKFIVDLFK